MKKILYIVEDEGSVQFRYRVQNVIGATKNTKFEVSWVSRERIEEVKLDGLDLAVIVRQTDKDGTMKDFIDRAHQVGIKVLFDLDDLIFNYKDLPVLMRATNSRNGLYWMGYFWGVRRIAKKVDGFLCTNDFLGKKLERSFGKSYKVIPNSLNGEQVAVSERVVSSGRKKHDGFVVGYFSGSPTHTKDFAMVEPELIRFLNKYKDAKLLVVGYMKFSEKMQKLIKVGRAKVQKPVDYLKLQELMAKVDVNIAPLVIDDFTNCKSELKFFEAAVVETTTIASPTYAFRKAIKDGKNGFLAQLGEWYEKLEYLYKNPKENRRIALAAKEYALKHYIGKEFLKEVENAFGQFIEKRM